MDQAVSVASRFIAQGVIVRTETAAKSWLISNPHSRLAAASTTCR
ncbi:MAG: hypothetical protein KF705_05535 [Phycisphaeraceae bacterium]|nr:hypothetical protein [Phycisphaeraceae bacterium]